MCARGVKEHRVTTSKSRTTELFETDDLAETVRTATVNCHVETRAPVYQCAAPVYSGQRQRSHESLIQ